MPDIEDGQTIEMQGSGAKPYMARVSAAATQAARPVAEKLDEGYVQNAVCLPRS